MILYWKKCSIFIWKGDNNNEISKYTDAVGCCWLDGIIQSLSARLYDQVPHLTIRHVKTNQICAELFPLKFEARAFELHSYTTLFITATYFLSRMFYIVLVKQKVFSNSFCCFWISISFFKGKSHEPFRHGNKYGRHKQKNLEVEEEKIFNELHHLKSKSCKEVDEFHSGMESEAL